METGLAYIKSQVSRWLFLISLVTIGVVIWDVGFIDQGHDKAWQRLYFEIFLIVILILQAVRLRKVTFTWPPSSFQVTEGLFTLINLFWVLRVFITRNVWLQEFSHKHGLYPLFTVYILIFCITEILKQSFKFSFFNLHPNILFATSFLLVIFGGSLLLMLPSSTTQNIDYIDALFTSTSAVCVTGLATMDTAKDFTRFGQSMILLLIQVGGLGIMTFTSLIAYFLKGGSSFGNQLIVKELTNTKALGSVFSILTKIIIITLITEIIGTILIYGSIPPPIRPDESDRIFFALFHSISAFCNAGFSTMSMGLFDEAFRYNYYLHLIIAVLIIIGGLGFNIVFDLYDTLAKWLKSLYYTVFWDRPFLHVARIANLHTKLVLITTFWLLVLPTIVFYFIERKESLADYPELGRWVESFFSAVTPRTAGFNTLDIADMTAPSIMLIMLLMYIGGSPGSTAGGIKTSVFAVGMLNIFSVAKGKKRVEFDLHEISSDSIQKTFSIIGLSLLAIGFLTFLLSMTELDKEISVLAFEVFSAFGTVGLTLNLTPSLSDGGKIIIILAMFIGRVGLFVLLSGLLPKPKSLHYRYPSEDIIVT